jgi:predicted Zn-dependent protease with MMP-like domain
MTLDEFEKETAAAIRALPAFFRERLENVAVLVCARPTAAQEKRFGPGLQGLYEGVSRLDRGQAYSGYMPDKITLFKNNIEASCGSGGGLRREIRNVLMHEIAHHFGMDDEELLRKGLY